MFSAKKLPELSFVESQTCQQLNASWDIHTACGVLQSYLTGDLHVAKRGSVLEWQKGKKHMSNAPGFSNNSQNWLRLQI